jgi:hypothetical protein
MSLMQLVATMVREAGSATVDDLMPRLGAMGVTRAQVLGALQNAKYAGLGITCERAKRLGVPAGQPAPAVYVSCEVRAHPVPRRTFKEIPRPPSTDPIAASVFELATPRARPVPVGVIYQPLGSWTD